jgi:hypothetical protein
VRADFVAEQLVDDFLTEAGVTVMEILTIPSKIIPL